MESEQQEIAAEADSIQQELSENETARTATQQETEAKKQELTSLQEQSAALGKRVEDLSKNLEASRKELKVIQQQVQNEEKKRTESDAAARQSQTLVAQTQNQLNNAQREQQEKQTENERLANEEERALSALETFLKLLQAAEIALNVIPINPFTLILRAAARLIVSKLNGQVEQRRSALEDKKQQHTAKAAELEKAKTHSQQVQAALTKTQADAKNKAEALKAQERVVGETKAKHVEQTNKVDSANAQVEERRSQYNTNLNQVLFFFHSPIVYTGLTFT